MIQIRIKLRSEIERWSANRGERASQNFFEHVHRSKSPPMSKVITRCWRSRYELLLWVHLWLEHLFPHMSQTQGFVWSTMCISTIKPLTGCLCSYTPLPITVLLPSSFLFEFEDATHLFAIRISVHNDCHCRCSNTRSNDHTHNSQQGHIPWRIFSIVRCFLFLGVTITYVK